MCLLYSVCEGIHLCWPFYAQGAQIIGQEVQLFHTSKPVQGTCPNDTYQLNLSTNTYQHFLFANGTAGCAANSYNPGFVNGIMVGDEETLCDDGYFNGSSCVAYTQGTCPDDYLNMPLSTNSVLALNNGSCNNGYTQTEVEGSCMGEATQTASCFTLCNSGFAYTATGACENIRCSFGNGVLESGSGHNFAMYSTQQTVPTLISYSGLDKCYINLKAGAVKGNGINIITRGRTYHLTD